MHNLHNSTSTPSHPISPLYTEHYEDGQPTSKTEILAAPDSYAHEDGHVRAAIEEISTKLRRAIKDAFEKGLASEFQKLGGQCRVYFHAVKVPDLGLRNFLSAVQVIWFPDWYSEYIADDGGYLCGSLGWRVIDISDGNDGTNCGLARSREDFIAVLQDIAEILLTITDELVEKFYDLILSEYRSFGFKDEPSGTPSANSLYLAFESMLADIPLIPDRIKSMLAVDNNHTEQQSSLLDFC